jgi:mono/diheme cytochrome c family protein
MHPMTRNQKAPVSVSHPCIYAALVAVLLGCGTVCGDDERSGELIFRLQCASCHGTAGEGTDEYPLPLTGTRSAAQLARFIAKSMPKDDPGTCRGEDAEKVAAYIYEQFYSPLAQARNKPARVELSRLTVRQYRNSVADLLGSFRSPLRWDDRRGLQGEYFKARRFRDNDRLLSRIDPEINFDFGERAPDPELFDANQFSIRWDGSVIAPDTGHYEFIVRTEHAARLWINSFKQPLIDAWVKSGDDSEYSASLFLIGGRAYPLRLEFSKAKQGVDDSDKQKDRPAVRASVALSWKRPKQSMQAIPSRNLMPTRVPETVIVATPFPPDDRSVGYERGTSISKAWDEATTEAALEVAGYVASRLGEFTGERGDAADGEASAREFCVQFAERAFRRPLNDEAREFFVHRRFEGVPDLDSAVKRVALLVLKSPRFLYREVGSGPALPLDGSLATAAVHAASGSSASSTNRAALDPYNVASRLSFALWDSLPDETLLKAAAAGTLVTRDQVVCQAERMIQDPRCRSKMRDFFLQWLKVDHVPELAKDPHRFPGFDQHLACDLRTSLELFLDHVMWSEASDFRQILLADSVFFNGRLAEFYGVELPRDAPFQLVPLSPGDRAGVLTHPYLMATFAYTESSSPIHRGVFLARSVLGRSLKPPPEAFTPLPAELHPSLTTRERVMLQTKPDACVKCHAMINPLGFTLEHFDAVGRFRDAENGRPIDASGAYQARTGESVSFPGVRGLASFLASSEEVHATFVELLFQYLVKQPVRAFGPRTLEDLQQSFEMSQYNMRNLVIDIAVLSTGTTLGVPLSTGGEGAEND